MLPPAVPSFTDQRTTGVALTGVPATLSVSGTEHVVRQPVVVEVMDRATIILRYYRQHDLAEHVSVARVCVRQYTSQQTALNIQESPAIAKMTARCALWTPRKISGVPGYAHGYFSRNC